MPYVKYSINSEGAKLTKVVKEEAAAAAVATTTSTLRERRNAFMEKKIAPSSKEDVTDDMILSRGVARITFTDGTRHKIPCTILKTGEGLIDVNAYMDAVEGWPCYACNRSTKGRRLRCSACRLAYYCGAECQRNDWAIHKHECVSRINASIVKLGLV